MTIAMLAVSTPRFVWTSDRPAFVGADTLLSERCRLRSIFCTARIQLYR